MAPINNISIYKENSQSFNNLNNCSYSNFDHKVAQIAKKEMNTLSAKHRVQFDLISLIERFKTNLRVILSEQKPVTEQQLEKIQLSANGIIDLLHQRKYLHPFFCGLNWSERTLFLLCLSDNDQKRIISSLRLGLKLQKKDLPECLNTLSTVPLLYKSSMRLINTFKRGFSVVLMDIKGDTVVFPLTGPKPSCYDPFTRLLIAFNCSKNELEILFKFNRLSELEFVEGLTLFFNSNPSIDEVEGFIKEIFLSLSFQKYEELISECNKKSVNWFFYFIAFINHQQLQNLLLIDREKLTKAMSFCLCDRHTETLLKRTCSDKSYFRRSIAAFYFQIKDVDSSVIDCSLFDLRDSFLKVNNLLKDENGEAAIVESYKSMINSIPPLVIRFLFKIFPEHFTTFSASAQFFNSEQRRFMPKIFPSSTLNIKIIKRKTIYDKPTNQSHIAFQRFWQNSDAYNQLFEQFDQTIMQKENPNKKVSVHIKRKCIDTLEVIEHTVNTNKGRKLNNDES